MTLIASSIARPPRNARPKASIPSTHRKLDLQGAANLWLGPTGPGPQTRLFRRVIESQHDVQAARIALFAESVYHLWLNGHYIGRGPVFHHPHRRPVAEYDLMKYWQAGRNVLAALVHAPGISLHNSIPAGQPGLVARVMTTNHLGRQCAYDSDFQWRATERTGFRGDVPRRGWALGFVEAFDSSDAPGNWTHPDYDDTAWPLADELPSDRDSFCWIQSGVPPLRHQWRPAAPLSIWSTHASPYPLHSPDSLATHAGFGRALDAEPWEEDSTLRIWGDPNQELVIDCLTRKRGAAICLDLGREYVGQVILECVCPNAGIIDIGWSELHVNGRPPLMRKNCTYAGRLYAAEGMNHLESIGFSGARYLVLVLRGFEGSLKLRRIGMRATEPDLDWTGDFHCGDKMLNDIWTLCAHTMRVGVQEGLMDCPTREQAPYLGDANLMGRWLGLLTGDWGHWRYLIRESFVRQSPDGLLRDAVFSGLRRSLVDYNLLAVIGVRDYVRLSGDIDTLRHVLEGCRHVFTWFNQRRDERGMVQVEWEQMQTEGQCEKCYDSASVGLPWAINLFIDHPGLGWHNVNDPGIDRSGINAAINALYVVAARAMAELEEAAGNDATVCHAAATTTAAASAQFFNPRQMAFADGIKDGRLLEQISQQTNTWCLWAGLCDSDLEQAVLQRVSRIDDPRLARGGPYFWIYIFEQFTRLNLHRDALDHLRALWGPMVHDGATTLWETFAGDGLDSRCHPWSAAPLEFLLCDILGLGGLTCRNQPPAYRPRFDLLSEARGAIPTYKGKASIQWRTDGKGSIHITGELPAGMTAALIFPDGTEAGMVRGRWEHRISGTETALQKVPPVPSPAESSRIKHVLAL